MQPSTELNAAMANSCLHQGTVTMETLTPNAGISDLLSQDTAIFSQDTVLMASREIPAVTNDDLAFVMSAEPGLIRRELRGNVDCPACQAAPCPDCTCDCPAAHDLPYNPLPTYESMESFEERRLRHQLQLAQRNKDCKECDEDKIKDEATGNDGFTTYAEFSRRYDHYQYMELSSSSDEEAYYY